MVLWTGVVELISFYVAWPASWRWPGLPAAEIWSMRGTPGIPDVSGWNLWQHRSTGISAERRVLWEGGSGSSFLLSEEKQFQLLGKLGTSTKAATVMSSNTKHNINRRRHWSEKGIFFQNSSKGVLRLEELWKVSVLRLLWIMLISSKVALKNVCFKTRQCSLKNNS